MLFLIKIFLSKYGKTSSSVFASLRSNPGVCGMTPGLLRSSQRRRGFTLVELLLYVAVSSIILFVLSGFLLIMLQARVKNQTIAEVEQQGTMVMRQIAQTVQNATGIVSPSAGAVASSLTLDVTDSLKTPTIFSSSGGVLQVTEGPISYQTISFVQSDFNAVSSPVVLPSSVTDGNLIVVGIMVNNQNISANEITDNYGNTYTEVIEEINGLNHIAIFYAKNVVGGPNFTVSSIINNRTLTVHEYSGVDPTDPLDQFTSGIGNSRNLNSGNITTAIDGELYFGVGFGGRNGNSWTAGTNYTIREQVTTPLNSRIATEDKFGPAQTTAATFSTSQSNPWAAAIATFKPAAISPVYMLTNNRVTVSGLSFRNMSRPGTPGTIRTQFTITLKNPENRQEFNFSKTFYGSMSIR
jgi:type II secretory pathway pseudopilin PulG